MISLKNAIVGISFIIILCAVIVVFMGMSDGMGKVCIIDPDTGACMIDITDEAREAYSPGFESRECGPHDRYYDLTRYICIREINNATNPNHIARGADKELVTYFTRVDGNTYIYDSKTFPNLQVNHSYYIVQLIQVGYCHGPSKIKEAREYQSLCNGSSTSPDGIPLGYYLDV